MFPIGAVPVHTEILSREFHVDLMNSNFIQNSGENYDFSSRLISHQLEIVYKGGNLLCSYFTWFRKETVPKRFVLSKLCGGINSSFPCSSFLPHRTPFSFLSWLSVNSAVKTLIHNSTNKTDFLLLNILHSEEIYY